MERRQLEYFLAVIDAGGFTAAAAAQHVSQPGLSHAIKTLERELGAALFHRLPRGARLTAAGEVLAESARRIVRETEIARARVADVAGVVIGRLDLVALPGLLVAPLAVHPPLRRNVYLLRRTGSFSPAAQAMRALLLPDT